MEGLPGAEGEGRAVRPEEDQGQEAPGLQGECILLTRERVGTTRERKALRASSA